MKMNHGDMVQKSTLSKALVVKWKPSKLGVSDDLFSIEGVAILLGLISYPFISLISRSKCSTMEVKSI